MLNKAKEFDKAGKYYEMAFEADTTETRFTYLSKAANAYENAGSYPKAFELFQKAVDENPEHTLADVYALGAAYYSAGLKLQNKEYLTKASEVFGQVLEMTPENVDIMMMQARANSAMDPETTGGLAKPYYEKVLAIVQLDPEKYQKEIFEVYQYLGVYYFKTDKYDQAREYFVKVLEIDPENALAKQVIASIDSVR